MDSSDVTILLPEFQRNSFHSIRWNFSAC